MVPSVVSPVQFIVNNSRNRCACCSAAKRSATRFLPASPMRSRRCLYCRLKSNTAQFKRDIRELIRFMARYLRDLVAVILTCFSLAFTFCAHAQSSSISNLE